MKLIFKALIIGTLVAFGAADLVHADDWLQWRGPNREDRSTESDLMQSWPAEGPNQLWVNRNCGLGYAGFSIQGDRLYTLGLDGDSEFALCLNAETGEEIWRQPVGPKFQNQWGDGPRSTPTIDGDRIYCLFASGVLACLNAGDGRVVWKKDMAELGGSVPFWGYSESPLVDGDLVVCTPGGKDGAIAAMNKMTGEKVWQTEELIPPAHYSSIIAADWGGKRQYIQLLVNAVVGIDSENGDVLWQSPWKGEIAVIPTPIFHDGVVYVTSGYKVGSKAIQLDEDNNATEKWFSIEMQNHHGGVIRVDDHVYGYSDRAGWCCQSLETGELEWNVSRREITKGAITYAGGRFYHLEERDGDVILLEATPEGHQEHGRFTLEPKSENRSPRGAIWVHPVVSDGKLYLRDQEIVHCYDIRKK